jgi:hypothetical protein
MQAEGGSGMNMPLMRDTALADAKTKAVLPYIEELGNLGDCATIYLQQIALQAIRQIKDQNTLSLICSRAESKIITIENRQRDMQLEP